MTASLEAIAACAAVLDDAQLRAAPTAQLSQSGALDIHDAYRVQHALLARRTARGERIVGLKLGFTSRAKAVQMGVHELILGTLTDRMRIPDGGVFDPAAGIHPRIEPEVAYRMDRDGRITAVAPALEIIDSRYADFRFDLGDVVADNTSACAFVVGEWRSRAEAGPLGNRAVRLEIDGRIVQTGSTAAICGDPARARGAAERLAGAHGFGSNAGGILLAGAATEAVPVPARGVIEATVAGLGRVSVRTAEGAGR
ncbi:4-oxalocrotonate decarboxylase [Microbacterium soli]|uniref:Fumarylacetoacetate hydrolase family protein n=1 Tax=Microbacterium soli TaxID=446075 RepID=A0ABP7N4L6_9MICO